MELGKAQKIAAEVVKALAPYCSRIEVTGSIRRRKPLVNDIDIVLIPSNQGQLIGALQSLGKIKMGGQKLIRCQIEGAGKEWRFDLPPIVLDVYVATPETWATLLLIRTGSKAHNIQLCTLAKRKGMKLHADGSGLFAIQDAALSRPPKRIAGDTEASIFEALGLPYKEPEERE